MTGGVIVNAPHKQRKLCIRIDILPSRTITDDAIRDAIALGVDFISARIDGAVSASYEEED